MFDVAVDLRRASPKFGKFVGGIRGEKSQRWTPPGGRTDFWWQVIRPIFCEERRTTGAENISGPCWGAPRLLAFTGL